MRVYLDTLEYVREESLDFDEEEGDGLQPEAQEAPTATVSRSDASKGAASSSPRLVASTLIAEPGWIPTKELRFTLLDGAEVRALFQGTVTQDSIDMLTELLRITKKGFPQGTSANAITPAEGDKSEGV